MKINLSMRIVICPHCGKKLRVLSSVTKIPEHTLPDSPSEPCRGVGAPINGR